MKKKNIFTKILAFAGTTLVWLPVLAPVIFSAVSFFIDRRFRFDYLMPAELFPLILAGSGLLLWAAVRAKMHVKLIGWSLVAALGMLILGQTIASVSGLASGRIEPTGIWWMLVVASLAAYVISAAVIGIGGIMLLRDIFYIK